MEDTQNNIEATTSSAQPSPSLKVSQYFIDNLESFEKFGDSVLMNAFTFPHHDTFSRNDFLPIVYQESEALRAHTMELWFESCNTWTLYLNNAIKLTDDCFKAANILASAWENAFKKTIHVEIADKPLISERFEVPQTTQASPAVVN